MKRRSPRVVSIGFHAGARVPAHGVSPGWVMLSAMKEARLQAWAAAHEFAPFTASTVITREAFLDQVRLARRQDHWISVGQLDSGLSGVATALRDRHGECKAALGMTLQTAHWPQELIVSRLVPQLLETAQVLRPLV